VTRQLPTFSVIIPTRNRETQLASCLRALAAQEYPNDRFEVVVADDGSRRPPQEIVASAAKQLNVRLVLESAAHGPAAARNAAAAQARGEFLAFTDDDCEPAPNWLRSLAARLTTCPTHLIGGRTFNALSENIYSEASQALIDIIYAHFNPHPEQAKFFATNNLAMPATEFRAVGGFASSFRFAEDREFCDRWLHHGRRMIYAPEVAVYHRHPLSLLSLWRQHFHYGRGAFLFHRVRARRGWGQLRTEPIFYLKLFRYPLASTGATRRLLMEALLTEIQLANAAGFFFQAMKGAVPSVEPPPLKVGHRGFMDSA
jgi:glycosyltransferase involved in cell wall biosynthesis